MISWRTSSHGTLHAAYLGRVRVGYVAEVTSAKFCGHRWGLNLLRPEGGHYTGRSDLLEEAKVEMERCLREWLEAVGLGVPDYPASMRRTT
jgi:hypothetical protein